MANRISQDTRKLILRLLCEGNSIRSTSRITGAEKKTVSRVILGFGQACKIFLDEMLRGLTLDHCEVDEIWSFVGKKQARLTVEEKQLRHDIGDVYLFTAVDRETKPIPTFVVGKRTADNARRFMVFITQISTDGFPGYPEAVDLAFGGHAKFGTIIKEYKNATMAYDPSKMIGTKPTAHVGLSQYQERTICTSHVERNNGTIRSFIKRFTRLTNAFSKKLENHEAAIAMFIAYYNFVWRTRHTDQSGKPGKLRPTAAMMAKVVPDLWDFDRFYNEVCQYGYASGPVDLAGLFRWRTVV